MSRLVKEKIETYFLSGLLFISIILVFLVMRPYLPVLLLAVVFVVLFQPVSDWLYSHFVKMRLVSGILTTILVLLLIMAPLTYLAFLVFGELTYFINSPGHNLLRDVPLPSFAQNLNLDLKSYAKGLVSGTLNDIGGIFSNVANLFVALILTVVSMIYLFKDGMIIKESLFKALPFTNTQRIKFEKDMTNGIRAVIGGYFLIAILQGIVTGFGFWIFQIPNPALWGFLAMILALLPALGTALVNIPGVVYLFATQNVGLGIGLLAWYLLSLAFIDNFIGPRFISGRVKIHPLLLIFSAIGGVSLFGGIGVITGPMVMIFFWSIMEIFQDREEQLIQNDGLEK